MTSYAFSLPSRLLPYVTAYDNIEEIRLREGQPVSITAGGKNLRLSESMSRSDMEDILYRLCSGSVHTYEKTMRQGYFTVDGGVRVGVAGEVSVSGSQAGVFTHVTALNIRIPRRLYGKGNRICDLLRREGYRGGVLFFGLPGCGKTTLIRDVIRTLSASPHLRRIVAVDSRYELKDEEGFRDTLCDFLQGVGRGEGMEMALRSLNPQYLACDEIGTAEDARQILSMQNTGVPLLATAHGDSLESLLLREPIRVLTADKVFRYFIRITSDNGERCYTLFRENGEESNL